MSRANRWRKHRKCHAKIRAEERYSLALTNQDLANIAGMINNRKFIVRKRLSHTKSVNLVRYQQRRLVVLYSHRHNEVITFLPPDSRHAVTLQARLRYGTVQSSGKGAVTDAIA